MVKTIKVLMKIGKKKKSQKYGRRKIKRNNIKYINVCENPIDMILRIKSINIYTAGGKVSIPAINKEQVEFFNYIVQERV